MVQTEVDYLFEQREEMYTEAYNAGFEDGKKSQSIFNLKLAAVFFFCGIGMYNLVIVLAWLIYKAMEAIA